MSANDLVKNYVEYINEIGALINKEHKQSIPGVLVIITTKLVPQMIVDIGKIKNLKEEQKKKLLIDTLNLVIDNSMDLTQLPQDEKDSLKILVTTVADPLVDTFGKFKSKKCKCF
ncbi:MAG: hypothetical protein QW478_00865 [Candidatus Micrarchaeaceae archaeon]